VLNAQPCARAGVRKVRQEEAAVSVTKRRLVPGNQQDSAAVEAFESAALICPGGLSRGWRGSARRVPPVHVCVGQRQHVKLRRCGDVLCNQDVVKRGDERDAVEAWSLFVSGTLVRKPIDGAKAAPANWSTEDDPAARPGKVMWEMSPWRT
jgi:hypothetical protein